jgi:hypothetical protein
VNGWLAHDRGDLETAHRFAIQEGELWEASGDRAGLLNWANDLADLETRRGNLRGAFDVIMAHLDETIEYADPHMLYVLARTLASVIGQEHPRESARLIGAAEQFRIVEGMPTSSYDEEREEPFIAPIRALLSSSQWEDDLQQGATTNLADFMRQLAGLNISEAPPD